MLRVFEVCGFTRDARLGLMHGMLLIAVIATAIMYPLGSIKKSLVLKPVEIWYVSVFHCDAIVL